MDLFWTRHVYHHLLDLQRDRPSSLHRRFQLVPHSRILVERNPAFLPLCIDWEARFGSDREDYLNSSWKRGGGIFPHQAGILLLPLHLVGRLLRRTFFNLQHSSCEIPIHRRTLRRSAGVAANSGGGTLVLASHGAVRRSFFLPSLLFGFAHVGSLVHIADHWTRRRISAR